MFERGIHMPDLKTVRPLLALLGSLALIAAPGVRTEQAATRQGFALATLQKTNGKIAFTNTRDGNAQIYVMNPDGSSQTRLTNNFALDTDPAWSPDGARIVFTSTRDGNEEIYVMNGDGSNQTRLTNNAAIDRSPVWSPDGAQIAFVSNRRSTNFDIFVMNIDGSAQTNISNGGAQADFQDPEWSPDGTKIALQSDLSFSFDVYTINAAGGNQAELTNSIFQVSQPAWQPRSTIPSNPIDDPQLFVRRQYLDLLNRQPDPGGLAYWVSQITQCGGDQSCINRKRVDVAAAFFIEQEFQQTGFFVDRFYEAALCRRPTFAEFTADRSMVKAGPNLEANKQVFAQGFVQRAEFIQKYPSIMIPSGFVDALLATVRNCSGLDLTSE